MEFDAGETVSGERVGGVLVGDDDDENRVCLSLMVSRRSTASGERG